MRRVPVVLLFLQLAIAGVLFAQTPEAEEILNSVEQNLSGVNDYVVDLEADVKMERLRMPRMKAKLYFKKPDKVHFESSSFAMLPREGMFVDPARLRALYNFRLTGKDTVEKRETFHLELTAKEEKTRLRQLSLWVDPTNWTIVRMQTTPYEGRTLAIDFTYGLQEGKYWLVSSMEAAFMGFLPDTARATGTLPSEIATQFPDMQRAPRGGAVTVRYTNYKVNIGLGDEIFEQKTKE